MDFGKLLGSIGKFFGGGNNKEDEERKRQQQKQATQQRQQQQQNRPKGPTVAQPTLNTQMVSEDRLAPPTIAAPKLGGTSPVQLSEAEKKTVADYNNPKTNAGFDKSRQIFDDILKDPSNPEYKQAQKLSPFITRNKLQTQVNRTLAETGQFAKDIAMAPVDVLQTAVKAPLRVANEVTGNKDGTKLNPLLGKLLGEKDNNVGTVTQYGDESLQGVGGIVKKDLSKTPEWAKLALGGAQTILDLTPAGGAFAGVRLAEKQGVKAGLRRATGEKGLAEVDSEISTAARLRQAEDTALQAPTQTERPIASTSLEQKPGAREPQTSITQTPPSEQAPAITSANPNWVPPTAQPTIQPPVQQFPEQAPQLGAPQLAQPELPPQALTPEIDPIQLQQAEMQQQLDAQALAPQPELPAPTAQVLEAPSVQQSRVMAQEAAPISPEVISEAIAREVAQQVPEFAVPRLEASRTMSLGKPSVKGNSKAVYGTNDANLSQIIRSSVIAAKGTAMTAGEHADALAKAGFNRSEIKAIRDYSIKNADKNTGQLDSTQLREFIQTLKTPQTKTVSAPTQSTVEGIPSFDDLFSATPTPTLSAPTPSAPAGGLGKIAQSTIQAGNKLDDAGWEQLAREVGDSANARAAEIGSDVPSILDRVQRAYEARGKVRSAQQAGLSADEFDLYKKMTNEMDYLRSRADPSLVTGGKIGQWYSPRQAVDTEFDPSLINEKSRSSGGVDRKELDLTTTPIEQYIRRYGNAERVVAENAVNAIENVRVKNANGADEIVPTGVKVTPEARAKLDEGAKRYIEKKDQIEKVLAQDSMDVKSIDDLTRQMDDDIDATFKELMDSIPKNTAEGREAIARLTEQRGAYLQSSIRSNMFSNIVNRSMDQVQSGIIKSSNQMMRISDSLTGAALGQGRALAKGRDAKSVAKKYAKGSLFKQIGRDFRTNMTFAGDNILRKADVASRAGGTALTSGGDLTTTTVKTANLAMLARAQAEGITDKVGLDKYLRQNLNSPEYKELLQGIQDTYAGYVSMPMSAGSRLGRANGGGVSSTLSKFDNAIADSTKLKELGVPPRLRRELNDLLMPALTGFAGATYRVGAKSLNAAALGVPGMMKGLRIAKEGGETSRQIGQILIARSLVDGALGGTAAAATVGTLMAQNAEWTGGYPSDPNERARWERDGIQPNALSFDLGNGEKMQVQPGRLLGALALPVVLPAVIKSGGNVSDVIEGTMGQMLDNLGANSILTTAKNISQAMIGNEGEKEQARKQLLNTAGFSTSAIIPVSGALNNVANATDEVKRDTSGGFLDTIKNRIPGARQTLDVKKDNLGDPIRNNTQASLGSSVLTTAKNGKAVAGKEVDPLDGEIDRLAKSDFEVVPGQDVENTNSKSDAKMLMNTNLYKNAPDDKKAEYLNKALKGTDTKDIDTSLDETRRTALIEHKLMPEDQRKKWLEDNTNALNYYSGDYDNAKARGTLTAKDDNLEEKDGKRYKMLRAQVNQETNADSNLQLLYDNISETEWRDMIDGDGEDDDPETAQRLYDYDQARTAKGVSGKSSTSAKPKFTEKGAGKGGSGGKGGGGKGGDNFAFASMPSSLIGTETSGSKYDKGERLFKPIADLQAPTKSEIPKSRSISVKRGVQL